MASLGSSQGLGHSQGTEEISDHRWSPLSPAASCSSVLCSEEARNCIESPPSMGYILPGQGSRGCSASGSQSLLSFRARGWSVSSEGNPCPLPLLSLLPLPSRPDLGFWKTKAKRSPQPHLFSTLPQASSKAPQAIPALGEEGGGREPRR